jgi:tetratricopeptide (TPR) repeat protein
MSQDVPAGCCDGLRGKAVGLIRGTTEGVVLALVCLSPWAFGAVHPFFELCLFAGIAGALVLWGARMLLEGQLSWQKCPVALCLAALFVLGAFQVTPLPAGLLRVLSPATARRYESLLPSRPEVLPFGEARGAAAELVGATLSLSPGATRQALPKLLAVFLLFAVVRNNVEPAAGLRRLSLAVLINGVLLALFGLVQFFTAGNTLYWTFPSSGAAFGPFLYRNHFACYLNLCLGLSVGLVLSWMSSGAGRDGDPGRAWRGQLDGPEPARGLRHLAGTLLSRPQLLWVGGALALMLSSAVFCLSRGGLLVLAGCCLAGLIVGAFRTSLRVVLATGLLIGLAALVAAAWSGFDRVQARLGTLWSGEALHDARLARWRSDWPLIREFPVWGTGLGTFTPLEPLHPVAREDAAAIQEMLGRGNARAPRHAVPAEDAVPLWEHAHDDYLEALVEGGLVRLGVTLVAIGLMFWLGFRAVRRHAGRPAGCLALGALLAFTAFVLHSFVDFVIYLPAIAVLAAVLCAHLAGLGRAPTVPDDGGPPPAGGAGGNVFTLRLLGLAPAAGAVAAVLLGVVLWGAGRRAERAEWFRLAAMRAGVHGDAGGQERRLAYLTEAVRHTPENASLQLELADAYHRQFRDQIGKAAAAAWQAGAPAALAATAVGLAQPHAPPVCLAYLCRGPGAVAAWSGLADGQVRRLARAHLVPALRHYLRARDLCPLLADPHVRIAADVSWLARADSRVTYIRRALQLLPGDAELWYLAGSEELLDGRPELAWQSWRRALEVSDRYLAVVLDRAGRVLAPRDVLAKVLPDRPEVLLAAADRLYPDGPRAAGRRPFLAKALRLLADRSEPLSARDLRLKGMVHRALGQRKEAVAAYRAALARERRQSAWRYELAALLLDEGQLLQARREVLVVLAQSAEDDRARRLFREVERRMARNRRKGGGGP